MQLHLAAGDLRLVRSARANHRRASGLVQTSPPLCCYVLRPSDAVAAPGKRPARASDAAEDAVCLAVPAVPLRALKTSCGLSERSHDGHPVDD